MEAGNDEFMVPVPDGSIRHRILELQTEHRDLDAAIALLGDRAGDELQLRRLKKRKLLIKDMITRLQMGLVPDIPA